MKKLTEEQKKEILIRAGIYGSDEQAVMLFFAGYNLATEDALKLEKITNTQ